MGFLQRIPMVRAPSRDVRTMRAWCSAFGKPFVRDRHPLATAFIHRSCAHVASNFPRVLIGVERDGEQVSS